MSHSNACPIATQGHSAILEKQELSNRSRTCQVKPLPPLFGTAYPLSPEYRDREDPVHRERPMLSTIDVAWEICDSGNKLPFRQRRLEVTDTGDPAIRRCHPELLCQRSGRGLLAFQVLDRRAYRIGPPRCCWPPPVSL